MEKYRILSKKGEGTFAEVLKCQNIADGQMCAVKRMKGRFVSLEQVNNLREVQALRRLNPHPNIIKLLEVIFDKPNKRLDLVCELMDMNMYEKVRGRRHHLPEPLVKSYLYQLCKALDHMHRNGIFHRDVKPENILIKDDVLKLADFGSCRGIYSKPPFTEYISTRWYRGPECLLTDGYYSFKMDTWSVGCVFFEIMSLYPLFPGSNELDQLSKIHDVLGTPPAPVLAKIRKTGSHVKFDFPHKAGTGLGKLLPHVSSECVDLLAGLLQYDPDLRLSARQTLRHPYLRDLRDADKRRHAAAVASSLGTPPTTKEAKPPRPVLKPSRPLDRRPGLDPGPAAASPLAVSALGMTTAALPKMAQPGTLRATVAREHGRAAAGPMLEQGVNLLPSVQGKPQVRTMKPARRNRRYANITSKINSGIAPLPAAVNRGAKPAAAPAAARAAQGPTELKPRHRPPHLGVFNLPTIT